MRVREPLPSATPAPPRAETAPVPQAPVSSNPARELLAMVRGRLDRRGGGGGRADAMRELELRAEEPEWRSPGDPQAPHLDPEAPGPDDDHDPRQAARALALAPPWSFPHVQAPDERWLRAAFAGAVGTADEVGVVEPADVTEPETKVDAAELAQHGARPTLAQHRPFQRLRDKEGPRARSAPGRRDRKVVPRPGLSRSDAAKLDKQRKAADAALDADPKLKKKDGEKPKKAGPGNTLDKVAGKPGKPGGPGVAVSGGEPGGGGGSADVEAWKKAQVDKAKGIKSPPAPDADRYVMTFHDAEVKRRELTPKEKSKLLTDSEKAVQPAAQPDNTPVFPNPDEIADAHKAVTEQTKKKLPEQTLPDLEPSPLGNQPVVGMTMKMGEDKQFHVMQEVKGADGKPKEVELKVVPDDIKTPPAPGTIQVKTPKPGDDHGKALAKLQQAGAAQQAELKKTAGKGKGKGKGISINSDVPMQPPTVPDFAKVDVGSVIAKALAAGQASNAVKVVEDARGQFAGGKLTEAEVKKFVAGQEPIVEAELRKVAAAAKVTDEALNKKVEDEKKKVAEQHDEARATVDATYAKTKDAVHGGYSEVGDWVSELREAIDRNADDEYDKAKGGTDPKEVKAKQKKYNEDSDALVVWWRAEYKRAGDRRVEQLREATGKEMKAYAAAAEIDYKQIDLTLGVKNLAERDAIIADPTKQGAAQYLATKTWMEQRQKELGVDAGKLIKKAGETAEAYRVDVGAGGVEANRLIDKWADDRLGRKKKWWQKLLAAILDWFGEAKTKSKEWQDTALEDNSANLSKDNIWLAKFQLGFSTDMTKEEVDANKSLTEEQKAMAKAMIASKGKDSAGALAAGLMARISQQQRQLLTRQFQADVMTWGSSEDLERVGQGEGGNVSGRFALKKAQSVHEAGVNQAGTNESGIFKALEGLTAIQGRAVERAYFEQYGRNIRTDLREEMYDWTQQLTGSRGDYDRSIQLLEGKGMAAKAVEMHQAMKENFLGTGWGTDSEKMHSLTKGLSASELALLKAEYKRLYGTDLMAEAKDELDDGFSTDHDIDRFEAEMQGDSKKAQLIAADQSMHGSAFFGLKTDRKQLEGVYEDVAAEVEKEGTEKGWDADTVKRKIAERYAELDADYEKRYGLNYPPEKRRNGESAMRSAMRESFTWGTGKGAFNLTTSTGDLDILLSYNDVGRKKNDPDIKKVFAQHRAEVATAKVEIEHRGLFYADDKEINKATLAPAEAAYKDNLRDQQLLLDKEREQVFDKIAERRNKAMDIEDKVKRKAALDAIGKDEETLRRDWATSGADNLYAQKQVTVRAKAREGAQADAAQTFELMKSTWDERYRGFNARNDIIRHDRGFEDTIKGDTGLGWMNGDSSVNFWNQKRTAANDKTMAILAGKGFLSQYDKLYFAIEGGGTDEEIAKEVFADTDKVEAKELLTKLGQKRLGVGDAPGDKEKAYDKAKAWVMDDFSGREGQDQTVAMMGVPRTIDDHIAIGKKRQEMETNSGPSKIAGMAPYLVPIGGALTLFPPTALIGAGILGTTAIAAGMAGFDRGTLDILRMEVEDLEALKREMDDKGIKPGDEAYDTYEQQISVLAAGVQDAVELHRAQVDAMTDVVTNVITAVITVAVIAISILAAPVTGGASAVAAFAAMTAVIGAIATTVATIAVKMALKGDAYGWEEMGYDAVVGLVEAVASGLTAGLGDKFLKVGFLAKMAEGGLISRLAAHGLANAAEGVIQALPGALAGNILNDELTRGGNPLAAIVMGTVTQVGMAGTMSGVMGGLMGGIRKPTHLITPGAAQYDDLFHAYKGKNPGATHEQFRVDLHNTILHGEHPGLGKKQLNDVAREQLLHGLDGDAAKAFKKVKVEVVTGEEFTRLTQNAGKGEAVVMFRGGEPTVVVKAGADLQTLHREAPHLMQGIADDTKHLIAKLDEKVLANWHKLPLEQQVDLYKTKLALEIDAHEQMIENLRGGKKLGKALGPEGVARELEYAETTLANLRKRAKEVDGLDLDALKASGKKPQYLDEPARLFSKKTTGFTELPTLDPGPHPKFDDGEIQRPRLAPSVYSGDERTGLLGQLVGDVHDPSIPKLHPDSPLAADHVMVGYTDPNGKLRFAVETTPHVEGRRLPLPEDGHYWYRENDGSFTHKRVKVGDGEARGAFKSRRYNEITGEFETVEGTATNWAGRSKNIVDNAKRQKFGSFPDFDAKVIKAIDDLPGTKVPLSADDKILLSRWADVLAAVKGHMSAADQDALFASLVKVFEDRPLKKGLTQTQDDAFREVIRRKIGDVIGSQPPAIRRDLLDKALAVAQKRGNADKGHLFTDVVRGHLETAEKKIVRLTDIPMKQPIPDHPGRVQADRSFDDAFEVAKPLGENGPTTGKFFGENKSGPGAFDLDQSLDYVGRFTTTGADGKIATHAHTVKVGDVEHEMQGVVTMFANADDAEKALSKLAADAKRGAAFREMFGGAPRRFYIGYYDAGGELKFLGPDDLVKLKPPPGGGGPGGAVPSPKRTGGKKPPIIEGGAAYVPGSDFRGYHPSAAWRPDQVANDAAAALGGIPGVVPVAGPPPNRFKVTISARREIDVRVMPRSMGGNELADVANFRYHKHTNTAVVQVSEHATEEQLERAIHHEVGELRQAFKRSASTTDLLAPGTRPHADASMSPHDAGRVAEIEWLTRKLATDPARHDLKRELHAMIEELGLRKGFIGADERLAMVKRKLSSDAFAMLEPMRVGIRRLSPVDAALVRDLRLARKTDLLTARAQRPGRPSRAMIDLKRPGDPPGPLSQATLRERAKEAVAAREAKSKQTYRSYRAKQAAGTMGAIDSPQIGGGAALAGLDKNRLLVDDAGRWHVDRSKTLAQTARQLDGVKAAHLGDPSQAGKPHQRAPLTAVQSWEDFRAAQGPVLNGKATLKLEASGEFTMVVKMTSGEVLHLPVKGTPVLATGFTPESAPGSYRMHERMTPGDHATARAQNAQARADWEELKRQHPGKVFMGDEANLTTFDPTRSDDWLIAGTGGTSVSTAEIILKGNPNARVRMIGWELTAGLDTNPQYLKMMERFGTGADPRFQTRTGVRVGTITTDVHGKVDLSGQKGDAVVSALGGRNKVPAAIEQAVKDHLAVAGNRVKGVALRDTDGHYLGYRLVFEPTGHQVDVTGSASRFPPFDIEFDPNDRAFMRRSSASDAPAESGNFDGGFAASAEQAARYHRAKARGLIP